MLRRTYGLPHSAGRWLSQVAASVGATLVASLIYSALPRMAAPDPAAPAPAADETLSERSSGGKFMARAVHPPARDAADGLDGMPVPRVAARAVPAAFVLSPLPSEPIGPVAAQAPDRRAVWDDAVPDRPRPPKASRAVPHAEPKRTVSAVESGPRPAAPARSADAGRPAAGDAEDGLLPRVLSGARDAWAATTETSRSLVARVVPQLP